MRNMLLGALVLVTAACGAYQFPSASPSTGTGNISGHVSAVPCGPVEPGGGACAKRLIAGVEIDYSDGRNSGTAVTDSMGAYSIDLAAGTWKVTLKTYMRIITGPTVVTVAAGSHIVADYVLDTGIRVPVPQQ
jgi:hypothetical protein